MLKKHHPLYINTHFNHPRELTPEAARACALLADAGIPLGCQTVLMKGVNDDLETMKELMLGLLDMRVKPYYLYQADLVTGTGHFRTDVQTGIDIVNGLQGHITGFAVPTYIIDAPGGGGKMAIGPNRLLELNDEHAVMENYEGKTFNYPARGAGDADVPQGTLIQDYV